MDTIAESPEASAELEHILSDLLKFACESTAAEAGFVSLVEASTGDLVIMHTCGTAHKDMAAGDRGAQVHRHGVYKPAGCGNPQTEHSHGGEPQGEHDEQARSSDQSTARSLRHGTQAARIATGRT